MPKRSGGGYARKASKSKSGSGSSEGGSRSSRRDDRDEEESKLRHEVGGMWENETRDGEPCFSIAIEGEKLEELFDMEGIRLGDDFRLVCFLNQFKEDGDRRPEFRVYKSDPPKKSKKSKKKKYSKRRDDDDDDD